jgi:hypothetical protein
LDGRRQYVTVGRSSNLNPKRKNITVPIEDDAGIAGLLRKRDQAGVSIIRSIPEATKYGAWVKCPSDELPDIKTVMVVPINGYIGGVKTMIGILYITSPKNPFMQMHVEPAMAFADVLGCVYPVITGKQK